MTSRLQLHPIGNKPTGKRQHQLRVINQGILTEGENSTVNLLALTSLDHLLLKLKMNIFLGFFSKQVIKLY
jgi:hypothetical protein